MPAANADQCVTVRLPRGVADELRAATNTPISRLLRAMAMELLKRERQKRAGSPPPPFGSELRAEVAALPSPEA